MRTAQQIDRLMSIYRSDSQVYQLNRAGALAHLDPRLLEVLEQAAALSGMSGGAFDVTVQSLWRLYSQAAARGGLPRDAERRRAQALVDWRQLEFDKDIVRFRKPDMALTLNGLAKAMPRIRRWRRCRRTASAMRCSTPENSSRAGESRGAGRGYPAYATRATPMHWPRYMHRVAVSPRPGTMSAPLCRIIGTTISSIRCWATRRTNWLV